MVVVEVSAWVGVMSVVRVDMVGAEATSWDVLSGAGCGDEVVCGDMVGAVCGDVVGAASAVGVVVGGGLVIGE